MNKDLPLTSLHHCNQATRINQSVRLRATQETDHLACTAALYSLSVCGSSLTNDAEKRVAKETVY